MVRFSSEFGLKVCSLAMMFHGCCCCCCCAVVLIILFYCAFFPFLTLMDSFYLMIYLYACYLFVCFYDLKPSIFCYCCCCCNVYVVRSAIFSIYFIVSFSWLLVLSFKINRKQTRSPHALKIQIK